MNGSAQIISDAAPRVIAGPAGVVLLAHPHDQELIRDRLAREVAARAGIPPAAVAILSRRGRRPRVEINGAPSGHWQVSFSRTRGCILGALSAGGAVGVDVEWIDPGFRWQSVAAEFFPADLVASWAGLPPAEARRKFFHHWVRWEATLKCRGTGFGAAHPPAGRALAGAVFHELDLGVSHAGCLVQVASRQPWSACRMVRAAFQWKKHGWRTRLPETGERRLPLRHG